jgi:BirA family biotin operon repressor/biotin-[acetyl-CoA-carboxylase] ligase
MLAPLTEAALRETLADLGVQAPVRFDHETASTNATALQMAEAGAPEWTLVAAGHQTAGRGRLGRTWLDEPGRSLLFSVVLRPSLEPERAGLLTLMAGACVALACREVTGLEVRCKWPNDLQVGEGKAGGILAEARVSAGRIDHVVVGIGLNLADPPPDAPAATGLGGAEAASLLRAIVRRLRDAYRPADPSFATHTVEAWRAVSATLGRRVRAMTTAGRDVEGVAEDVAPDGSLVVETEAGERQIVAFGEVAHLRA